MGGKRPLPKEMNAIPTLEDAQAQWKMLCNPKEWDIVGGFKIAIVLFGGIELYRYFFNERKTEVERREKLEIERIREERKAALQPAIEAAASIQAAAAAPTAPAEQAL